MCIHQDLVVRVRKLGNEHLSEHISLKKDELCDALIEAQGMQGSATCSVHQFSHLNNRKLLEIFSILSLLLLQK